MKEIRQPSSRNGTFTLFFDGACPICMREIAWIRRRTAAEQVQYVDIASESFNASAYGLSQQDFMAQIRAQDEDGNILSGMEVFRRLYTYAGLGWLVMLSELPVVRQLADFAYSQFARHRLRLTGRHHCASCETRNGGI